MLINQTSKLQITKGKTTKTTIQESLCLDLIQARKYSRFCIYQIVARIH